MDRGQASSAEIYASGYSLDETARRALEVEVGETVVGEVRCALNPIRLEVGQFFGMALSDDEGPGFVRYASGGYYRRHCDVIPGRDDFPRRISLVVFLTTAGEDFDGGALRLYGHRRHEIAPRAGMLVAFPSDIPHEVLRVTGGVRDAVVDWLF